MKNLEFIWRYVNSCTSGALMPSECGPVWQLGVIAVLLCIAVTVLAVIRLRAVLPGAQGAQ